MGKLNGEVGEMGNCLLGMCQEGVERAGRTEQLRE